MTIVRPTDRAGEAVAGPAEAPGSLGQLTAPRIVTELPGPKARELLALARRYEPRST